MEQVVHEVSAWMIGAAALVAIGCFAAGYYFGQIERHIEDDCKEGGGLDG